MKTEKYNEGNKIVRLKVERQTESQVDFSFTHTYRPFISGQDDFPDPYNITLAVGADLCPQTGDIVSLTQLTVSTQMQFKYGGGDVFFYAALWRNAPAMKIIIAPYIGDVYDWYCHAALVPAEDFAAIKKAIHTAMSEAIWEAAAIANTPLTQYQEEQIMVEFNKYLVDNDLVDI